MTAGVACAGTGRALYCSWRRPTRRSDGRPASSHRPFCVSIQDSPAPERHEPRAAPGARQPAQGRVHLRGGGPPAPRGRHRRGAPGGPRPRRTPGHRAGPYPLLRGQPRARRAARGFAPPRLRRRGRSYARARITCRVEVGRIGHELDGDRMAEVRVEAALATEGCPGELHRDREVNSHTPGYLEHGAGVTQRLEIEVGATKARKRSAEDIARDVIAVCIAFRLAGSRDPQESAGVPGPTHLTSPVRRG